MAYLDMFSKVRAKQDSLSVEKPKQDENSQISFSSGQSRNATVACQCTRNAKSLDLMPTREGVF